MMTFLRYALTAVAAYLLQLGIDAVLPADTDRMLVIVVAGVGAILWAAFYDAVHGWKSVRVDQKIGERP
jgi:4-hydroxybenzoate polyprenyltransferase